MPFFTNDFTKFLSELQANNNREWFTENKKRFEKNLKKPFESFIRKMIERCAGVDPNLMIEPKNAIFRIYRDVRFSPDKSPYKTYLSAVISPGGRKETEKSGIYIEMRSDGISVYAGAYMPVKDNLHRIRTKIAGENDRFVKIINKKEFKNAFKEVLGEQNKRIPKEFNDAAEKQPLIYNKQFYIKSDMSAKIIKSDKLDEEVFERYLIAKPFNDFLDEAIR